MWIVFVLRSPPTKLHRLKSYKISQEEADRIKCVHMGSSSRCSHAYSIMLIFTTLQLVKVCSPSRNHLSKQNYFSHYFLNEGLLLFFQSLAFLHIICVKSLFEINVIKCNLTHNTSVAVDEERILSRQL